VNAPRRVVSAPTTALRSTLFDITSIPSPIGEEKALCDHLQQRFTRSLGAGSVLRYRDSLIVRVTEKPGLPKVALVGHTDVVRTQHDGPVRFEGERLYGPGAADMKSGLAVMIELAERIDRAALPCDLSLVFYEREEGPYDENVLGPMLEEFELLRSLDFAICLEPSTNELQLGCMGSVHATVRFEGRTAHSARPWQGENAILKSASFLLELEARAPADVVVDGFAFREVITPTLASGGRSRNVVPDQFELNLNYRFAPTRGPVQVADELRQMLGGRAVVEPKDLSPACRPHAGHPFVKWLSRCGVTGTQVKQAWTDVARFDQVGVPAVNLGPGTQSQAHQPNEYTELAPLDDGYVILHNFLMGLPPLR
jgi:succinyl-diaminopimelate desuccinylase